MKSDERFVHLIAKDAPLATTSNIPFFYNNPNPPHLSLCQDPHYCPTRLTGLPETKAEMLSETMSMSLCLVSRRFHPM